MADGPTNPGSIPVGGIYASVEIDTSTVNSDLGKIYDALVRVNAEVERFRAQMGNAAIDTTRAADACDTYAIEATAGKSAAQMFADAHFAVADATRQSAVGTQVATVATQTNVTATQVATQTIVRHAAAHNDAVSSARRFQYGLIQVAYVMDDVQYGARALTNNVAALASSFGGVYAGYIAIAATGTFLLYNHWDKLSGILTYGIPQTKTAAERMDELGKATKRTADETREYNELKERQQRIEAAAKAEAEEVKDQKQGVLQALSKSHGGKKIIGQLAGVMGAQGLGHDTEVETQIADKQEELRKMVQQLGPDAGASADVIALRAKITELKQLAEKKRQENLNRMASELVGDAMEDPDKLRSLIGWAKKNEKSFAPGFAARLEEATPEGIIKGHQDRIDQERRNRQIEEAGEANVEHTTKREERIKGYAKDLDDQYKRARLNGQRPTQGNIQASLKEAGIGEAAGVAAEVLRLLEDSYDKTVASKALHLGGVAPQAAEAELRKEDQVKDERQQIAREAETPLERQQRIARQKAERAHQTQLNRGYSRFGKSIRENLQKRTRQAGDAETGSFRTMDDTYQSFLRQGMTPEQANEAAVDFTLRAEQELKAQQEQKRLKQAAFRNPALRMNGANAAADRLDQARADEQAEDRLAKKIGDVIVKGLSPPLEKVAQNTKEMTDGVPMILT